MRRALSIYPYLAPALLAPLSLWLWWRHYQGQPQALALTALAWGLPVTWAYVVPAVGTNVLKVWEFDVRLRLGRFRPHHGFVFGSATATLAWLAHGTPASSALDVLRAALVLASVLGFWNLLYEVAALQSGLLKVYTQPWADGHSAETIAHDYAPWFFGGFGAVYGAALALAEWQAARLAGWAGGGYFALALVLACALPSAGFMWQSRRRHGHWGTRPVPRRAPAAQEPPP